MYEKYGEFDSCIEMNNKAAELKEAGDIEEIKVLAEENGLDPADVNDYIDGAIAELTTPVLAAIGKTEVEVREYKVKGILKDWITELEAELVENPDLARAVRRKGKSIAGYIAKTADYGFEHKAVVDKRIVAKCPTIKSVIGNHEFSIGIPDKRQRRQLMREYYLGGKP